MLLLVLSACQKELSPKEGVQQQTAVAKAGVQRNLLSSDLYTISSITVQYDTNSVGSYDAAQIDYTYNADGSLRNVSTVHTMKTKINDSIIVYVYPSTMDYTYSGDTVNVNRVIRNSSNQITTQLRLQYIKDSLGRWAKRSRQVTLGATGQTSATISEQFHYDSNNQLTSSTVSSSASSGFGTYYYTWLNGNLSSSTTSGTDQYTYDTNHPGQPGDLSVLSEQLNFGFAVPVSANVTTSDLNYDSRTNQFNNGSKYTYTFDSKGRVSSGVTLTVPSFAPQTTTFFSTTYINYVSN